MKTKKLIPKLRFPEFINEGEWRKKELDAFLDYIQPTEYLVKSTHYNDCYKTPVLTAGKSFILGYTDETEGIFNEKLPVIIFDDFTTSTQFVDFPFKGKSSAMKILIAKKSSDIKFIFEVMQLMKYEVGVHQRHWISIYSKLKIPFPDLKEQQKIASCLSSLDEVITAESQKLDALKEQKKGLMQNLFPQEGEKVPKYRFPEFVNDGEWEERKLEKIAIRITDKNESGSIKKVFTNSAADGIIDQRDFFDKDIANKSNLEGYYIVEPGDYVYNPRISNLAPIGPLAKNKTGNVGIMSPLYTVFRFKDKNNDFYEHYFKTTHWIENVRRIANMGARFDRMSITSLQLMSINVFFPKSNEQQKIASCLSSLDELIKAQSDRIEQLKLHKKGLMQGLFPKI